MNDQAHIGLPSLDRCKNLIKRHHHIVNLRFRPAEPQLQRQKRTGHFTGHGNLFAGDFLFRIMLLGYQHRAVSVAHTRPAGQQGVLIAHISVGVNADGADIQLAARGALVERLDILQNVFKGVPARINQILCQRIKHKGIVRIRRMA